MNINISVGLYPGILLGVRTYYEPFDDRRSIVLYIPFVYLGIDIES